MKAGRNWLLVFGAGLGVVMATASILSAPGSALPDDAVAVVNGRSIRRADYDTALAAVVADGKPGSLDAALRRHVLERLIDEELLVQAALELGLAERDRRVRADLSSATLSFIKDAPGPEPTAAELEGFFRENSGYFAASGRVEVEELFFSVPAPDQDAEAKARAARARDAWQRNAPVSADAPALPIPRGALPLPKLEQYLGPSATRALDALPVGVVSEPVRGGDGYRLLRVKSRAEGSPPRFEDVRELVRAEWRRRATEKQLREFLSDRRARAKLVLSPELGS